MKAVGVPISVDAATLTLARPSVARVNVEVDLLKELPSRIWIEHGDDGDGFWQKLVPENLPAYCTSCFRQGHSQEGCSMNEIRVHRTWKPKETDAPLASALTEKKKNILKAAGVAVEPGLNVDQNMAVASTSSTGQQQAARIVVNPTQKDLVVQTKVPATTSKQNTGEKRGVAAPVTQPPLSLAGNQRMNPTQEEPGASTWQDRDLMLEPSLAGVLENTMVESPLMSAGQLQKSSSEKAKAVMHTQLTGNAGGLDFEYSNATESTTHKNVGAGQPVAVVQDLETLSEMRVFSQSEGAGETVAAVHLAALSEMVSSQSEGAGETVAAVHDRGALSGQLASIGIVGGAHVHEGLSGKQASIEIAGDLSLVLSGKQRESTELEGTLCLVTSELADQKIKRVSAQNKTDWDHAFQKISGNILNSKDVFHDNYSAHTHVSHHVYFDTFSSIPVNVGADITLEDGVINSEIIHLEPNAISECHLIANDNFMLTGLENCDTSGQLEIMNNEMDHRVDSGVQPKLGFEDDRFADLNIAWQNLVSSNIAPGEFVELEQMGDVSHSGRGFLSAEQLEIEKQRKPGVSDRILRSMKQASNSDPSRPSSL